MFFAAFLILSIILVIFLGLIPIVLRLFLGGNFFDSSGSNGNNVLLLGGDVLEYSQILEL